jgi:transposase
MVKEIITADELTERQQEAIKLLVEGIPRNKVAQLCGYSNQSAIDWFLRSKKGALAFQQAMAQRLASGAPLMFATLQEIATNKAAPAGARVDAAKAWLDRAGWQAPRHQPEKATADKALSEMTAEELKRTVLELKALKAEPIAGDPDGLFD